tara:strand:+ start:232504 stop:232944 length:441 start_codon:yes stop_codon:yes gene_type:complete
MNDYKKILVAVELNPAEDKLTIAKAKKLAQDNNAQVCLIHAVEHINTYGTASAYPAIANVEEQISDEHQSQLNALAKELNVTEDNTYIEIGPPAVIVSDKAKELGSDLIVVGSHSRHGLALLLGSTADSILHKADCDILVVRLPNK